MVKMNPSESEHYPDLLLSVSTEVDKKYKDVISLLQRGNGMNFEAEMVKFGTEFSIHHLHLVSIQQDPSTFMEISDISVEPIDLSLHSK